ncbi:MAG: D-cysteine desulfhydrase, partial [Paraglaciecola sp.]
MDFNNIPKVLLGFFPTPLVELKNLSIKLGGPKIFMKRDDHTGLALGGNKTRKLEFILGDALAKGADTIITA